MNQSNRKKRGQQNISMTKEKPVRNLHSIISMIDRGNSNSRFRRMRNRTAGTNNNSADDKVDHGIWNSGMPATEYIVQLVRENDRNNHDNNTLYVIALHDYFLLPPTTNSGNGSRQGKKKPPRLSFILPALSPPSNPSSSASFNQRSMIRIVIIFI